MQRTRSWLLAALLLVLAVVDVPPWLVYKGNTIAFVCSIDVANLQPHGASTDATAEAVVTTKVYTDGSEHEGNFFEDARLSPSLQASIVATNNINKASLADMNDTSAQPTAPEQQHQEPQRRVVDTSIPAPSNFTTLTPNQPPALNNENVPPRRVQYGHTYYAKLSADPGTEEARVQHVQVAQTLMALPGKVTIRHQFGMDPDDVLNVISFKLEGTNDGLERVAALEGVIGIFPVRTRKRPKAIPLGSLQLTRPTLESAHLLTGVQAVHTRLGLTGKGIKVGIIDTGIDYNHPALGGCFGPGCKVAYGYDFVGDAYDNGDTTKDTPVPDSDPMDCAGHGTHVAGIVAAQNIASASSGPENFVGVAPEATLGAYRVFGCDGEVSDDILLAALKAAYRDGMDVVNLSLGGASGWPEEPFALACSAYVKKGLHISIANGNDGDEGLFEDGAPATAAGAIAVGSVDNTHFLGPAAHVSWKPMDGQGRVLSSVIKDDSGWGHATPAAFSVGMAMGADTADLPLVAFRSDITYVIHAPTGDADQGCKAYPPNFEKSLAGGGPTVPRQNIIVLIRRGGCTFSDKATNVAKAKLGGMFVYDTIPEQRPLGMAVSGVNISGAGLSFEDAGLILNAIKNMSRMANSRGGDRLIARFSGVDQLLPLASGGKISDFSSWGPDARLRYKPDVVSPGGMIYSTFPLAKGKFATLQGTSMASPYMAGVQALFLSKFGKTNPYKLLNLLQSTAVTTVRPGSRKSLTSVFQQGGGLIALERLFATDPPTVLTPTALYLNDTQHQQLEHQITFFNPSTTTTRTWTLTHRPAASVNGFEESNYYIPVNQSRLRLSEEGASGVVMTPSRLTLLPAQRGTVTVRILPPISLNADERWLFSGYLDFNCQATTHTSLPVVSRCDSSLVSYGGMHGRLAGIPILNPMLQYPALQLDRYANSRGDHTSGSNPRIPESGAHHQHHYHRQKHPKGRVRMELNSESPQERQRVESFPNADMMGANKERKKSHKNLFRDRKEIVKVGTNEGDWVQVLISVNFPTGLMTIEAESVCDGDRDQGLGRMRLEIGGLNKGRFQIESEEELAESQNVLQDEEDFGAAAVDIETLQLMKAKEARSKELAFMPSGLYMPYQGYSKVMVQPPTTDIQQDQEVRLHRKPLARNGRKDKSRKKKLSKDGKGVHKSSKVNWKKTSGGSSSKAIQKKKKKKTKKENQKSRSPKARGEKRPDRGRKPQKPGMKDHRHKKDNRAQTASKVACVPRILGLIPNGFNPWSTRTDSSESNAVQTFSWRGDLLLKNPSVHGDEGEGVDEQDRLERGQEVATKQKALGHKKGHKDGGGDTSVNDHKHHRKHPRKKSIKLGQASVSRDLPDGRYRLVLKVLKPWGIQGRATDLISRSFVALSSQQNGHTPRRAARLPRSIPTSNWLLQHEGRHKNPFSANFPASSSFRRLSTVADSLIEDSAFERNPHPPSSAPSLTTTSAARKYRGSGGVVHPWTKAMDGVLFDGRQRGLTWKTLSAKLNRPVGACYRRYYRVLDPFLVDAVEVNDDEAEDKVDDGCMQQDDKAFQRCSKANSENNLLTGSTGSRKNMSRYILGPWRAAEREMLERLVVAKTPWTEITRALDRNMDSCKEKWHRIETARLAQRREKRKVQSPHRKRLHKEGFRRYEMDRLTRAVDKFLAQKRARSAPPQNSAHGLLDIDQGAVFHALHQPISTDEIDWDVIAGTFNNKFSSEHLQTIYHELASAKLIWTPEEDERLIHAVVRLGPPELQPKIWSTIKDAFGDVYRSSDDYRDRWRVLDMPVLERAWDTHEKTKFWRRYMEYQRKGSLFSLPAFQPTQEPYGLLPKAENTAGTQSLNPPRDTRKDDTMWDVIAEGLEYRHSRDCEMYFKSVTNLFPKDPKVFEYLTHEVANVYLNRARATWSDEASRLLVATVNSYHLAKQAVPWRSVVKMLGNQYTVEQCQSRWHYWAQLGNGSPEQKQTSEQAQAGEAYIEALPSDQDEISVGSKAQSTPKSAPMLWSDKELELLVNGVESFGQNWAKIRDELLPHRTTHMLQERFWRTQHRKTGRFSFKERSLLESAIETYGEDASWELIATQVPGRSASQCRKNWNYSHTHHVGKLDEPWTTQDRERLKMAVDRLGKHQWTLVSEFVVGKTPAQCRHQWREKMDPSVNRTRWTDGERGRLMERIVTLTEVPKHVEKVVKDGVGGNSEMKPMFIDPNPRYKGKRKVDWKEVAKGMPGRTPEQCRLQFEVHRRLYFIPEDI
ncbi:hypothetical protein BG004_004797 [Podila humilis]|nr:hypothetical protein BG004_004797 [Podila humilis]